MIILHEKVSQENGIKFVSDDRVFLFVCTFVISSDCLHSQTYIRSLRSIFSKIKPFFHAESLSVIPSGFAQYEKSHLRENVLNIKYKSN